MRSLVINTDDEGSNEGVLASCFASFFVIAPLCLDDGEKEKEQEEEVAAQLAIKGQAQPQEEEVCGASEGVALLAFFTGGNQIWA